MIKLQKTIDTLTAKGIDNLSGYELQRLTNATMKIENRTLSKVYKDLKNASPEIRPLVVALVGKQFPSFKTFAAQAKEKPYFSIWDGLSMLRKLSPTAKLAAKVKKQGGKMTKKATTKAKAKQEPATV